MKTLLLSLMVLSITTSGCLDNIGTESDRERCYSTHPNPEVQSWGFDASELDYSQNYSSQTHEPLMYFVMESGCDTEISDLVFRVGENGAAFKNCIECVLEDELRWGDERYTFTEGETLKCEEGIHESVEIQIYSNSEGRVLSKIALRHSCPQPN